MSDPDQPSLVAPLTLRTRDGTLYTRPAPVEAQLAALAGLSLPEVAARARANRNVHHPDYVRDECLAYFLREGHRAGAEEGFGELVAEIERRVERRVRAQCTAFAVEVRDEVALHVTERLWRQLFTLTHPRGEFWQVAFGLALKRVISDARTRLFDTNRAAWATLRDTSGDAGDGGYDPLEREADAAEPLEARHLTGETTREALGAITDARHREAFVLRYQQEWPVEGDTPPTISGYFNVTSRTIRNWLATAHEQLRRWQEAQ